MYRALFRSLLFCLACSVTSSAVAQWYSFKSTAMTTDLSLEFWYESATEAEHISQQVFAVFDRVDAQMSSHKPDSELSRINNALPNAETKISSALFKVLNHAIEISKRSAGGFDISFGSVGYLYDYRAGHRPDAQALDALSSRINYRSIKLDPVRRTVRLTMSQMRLDLGGIAKGYAVDLGIEVLKTKGIKYASLSAGGDMRLLGDKRGKPWLVAVKDPRSEQQHAVVLPLDNVAVSTSGDYERYFIAENGERVHHILSPATGRPAKGIQSVTIIGNEAIETDGLSTAVFVLGVHAGLKMINKLDGIDAIIIDDKRKMHYSEGLMAP